VGNAYSVSTTGSDANPGTLARPWRTIAKAMATLTAGQTAFVRAGTYEEAKGGACNFDYNAIDWRRSGTSTAPITISGYPGEEKRVIVKTRLRLAGRYLRLANLVVEANTAYSTFDQVCNGGPNVNVWNSNVELSALEIRNSRMSGLYLDKATNVSVRRSWIHHNGTHWNLDHGIYYESGENGLIADNVIEGNYAHGIKLAPGPNNALVTNNTVVANGRSGVIVAGDDLQTADGCLMVNNVFAYNKDYGIRSYWTDGVGVGNVALRNLVYANASGPLLLLGGLATSETIERNPLFVDGATGNFRLLPESAGIDVARPEYAQAIDYDGNSRPRGSGPDIGAFER
jgi:parallel beta-helix repeat protein